MLTAVTAALLERADNTRAFDGEGGSCSSFKLYKSVYLLFNVICAVYSTA